MPHSARVNRTMRGTRQHETGEVILPCDYDPMQIAMCHNRKIGFNMTS